MKKLFLILLTLGIFTSFVITPIQTQATEPNQQQQSEFFENLSDANSHAVSILSFGKEGGNCSGAVLKNSNEGAYILTAKHCINMSEEMFVDTIPVITIQSSVSQDLALLKTNEQIPNKLGSKIALKDAERKSELFGIGFPLVTKPYVMHGKVFIKGFNNHYGLYKSIPGCSGAGLYNKNNYLIGIHWGSSEKFKVYEPISQIRKFLKEVHYVE